MQTTPASPVNDTTDDIDILALLGALIDHKWTIIACTLVFLVGGIAYALLATPIYQANAVIQVEKKSQGIGSLIGEGGASSMMADPSAVDTEVELLKSRKVIGRVVENLNLDLAARPTFFPVVGSFFHRRFDPSNEKPFAEPLFGLTEYAWGGEEIDVFQFEVPTPYEGQQLTVRAGEGETYSVLDQEKNILLEGKVGRLIENNEFKVQIARLAARPGTEFLVNRRNHLGAVIGYQNRVSVTEKGRNSGILLLTLQSPDPREAVRVLNEISEIYVRQNVERKSAEAQQSLEFLQQQLPEVRLQLEAAETALNQYQAKAGTVDITIETQAVLDQVVELETAISELQLKRSEMERRYTREHPSYQALLIQMDQLQARRDEITDRVGGLPETQQELLRLARDVKVSTEIYTTMLNNAQELDIMRAGTVGNVRVIDDAVAGLGPVKPRKMMIVAAATLLGLMIGIAIALLRHALNRGIENPEVIEQLGLPVYATVPFSKDQQVLERSFKGKQSHVMGSHLLAATNPADLAIESLRSLRTSLHFAMLEAKNNVLMISGPSPSVGKSFVSANLAAIVAQSGKKVVVVDSDMRKGYVHKLLNKEPEPGLSGVLASTHTLADVIHKTEVENLHFVSRGQIPPNPSELLMHANFENLLQQLSKIYDMVIVDTPPILAVTDAALVGRFAGTSLIVARFGLNPKKEILATLQRFSNNGIEIKGAIFNAVEKKASAYGYGNYGYYQYEYKSDKK